MVLGYILSFFVVFVIFFNSCSAAEIGLSTPSFTLGLTKINHENCAASTVHVDRSQFQPWAVLDFL